MHQPKDAGLVHLGPALAGGGAAMMFLLVAFLGAGAGLGDAAAQCQTQPTATRQSTKIPADYLTAYQAAGQSSGIPWTAIAAVGKVESNHGQSNDAGVHSGANHAGAMGPMQFLSGTWQTYGVDGDNDGTKNVYNPADAIPGAANYLKASGAPGDIHAALFTYNRSNKYVDTVLGWARRYGQQNPQPATAAQDPACQQAMPGTLPEGASTKTARKVIDYARAQLGKPYVFSRGPDGGITINPRVCPARKADMSDSKGATGVAQADPDQMQRCVSARVILYAASQIGKPYVWGAEGPDAFDCSGLTMMAYRSAGVSIPRVTFTQWSFGRRVRAGEEDLGDLVFFDSGPNSGSGHPGHVGIVLDPGNKTMIVAPHSGDNVKIAGYRRDDLMGFTRPPAR